MAVFIVYGQGFDDEDERDYEMEYVGTDGEKAFGMKADGLERLHMEVWVDNQVFERQTREHKKEWVKEYNLLDEIQETIKNDKKMVALSEARLSLMKKAAHSEGLQV